MSQLKTVRQGERSPLVLPSCSVLASRWPGPSTLGSCPGDPQSGANPHPHPPPKHLADAPGMMFEQMSALWPGPRDPQHPPPPGGNQPSGKVELESPLQVSAQGLPCPDPALEGL